MFDGRIDDVLLSNLNAIKEPDMFLGGLTIYVCGTASTEVNPSPSPKVTEVKLTQAAALVAVKAAIDTTGRLEWKLSKTAGPRQYCSWSGVSCDNAGNVQGLALKSRGLVGSLPSFEMLQALPKLESLGLGNNSLSGPLPDEYGRLTGLKQLYIWQNPVGGSLPCSLADIESLETLDASRAQLSGTLCPDFKFWRKIKEIQLWNNQLKGRLPPEYGAFRRLTKLILSGNRLTGTIPGSWQGMDSLEMLYLYSNKLTGSLPASLGMLASLQKLLLYQNLLVGTLPPEWSGMVS
jgi:hypothetical protein